MAPDTAAPSSWREIWKMARFALALKVNKHLAWPGFVRWIAGPDNRIVIHFGTTLEPTTTIKEET